MLRTRVLTALGLLIAFMSALFWLPAPAWAAFVGALVIPAAWEWSRLIQLTRAARGLYVIVVVATCALLFWSAPGTGQSGASGLLLPAIFLGASLFWVAVVPFWLWRSRLPQARWPGVLTGILVLVPTCLALVQLRQISPLLLLLLMSVAWISDTAAYFAGRRFGRRKLAPAVSPGKSWEGVAGAVLAVSLYALLWIHAWQDYLPPVLKTMRFGTYTMLLFVWLLTAVGIYGDLFESALKRRAGVKDSGTLLPGHGGVLDRVDALTAVLPVAALVYLL
ncbi:MAG: phosphatidate cytidylyltransferase [Pseudomonadota bacterium]